ncbi:hypothetical protein [Pseudomonas fluorescens]|uniref:hypothetical protein n=1 Tax=Pseudomonas fluorescens TaxID=294 RepID=UPI001BE6B64C|nr:hypothetical protein [Pseudomonas fluorescens]MBT2296789.1 hypothetical protein [Pseudomonas fluorescens]MBT2307851.1 hypothetical protein [Pseudomonas fluorescens]MBT2313071.1 hypothetical protein [Pseudomonas fluorescens]MBT2317378.1 hypothetical protein [Pseudomonas fluorescens]MBT2343712.1 hypothetical protein [Pseudomonas fluorescens]
MPIGQRSTTPQLIYLVYGAETYHQEAVFSITSALAGLRESPGEALEIQVFTDNPLPYAGLPVRVRTLDNETRQTWIEPHGYHFRAKHVVMRKVLEEVELALLIDTDTFFHCSPLELFRRIQPGTLLCNAVDLNYGANKDAVLYVTLAQVLQRRGLADDNMPQLNSGVIGLHWTDASVLDRSLALMDELYPMAKGAYTLEEFCLAVAAYRSVHVRECPDLIHHYWSRKQLFRAKTKAWLDKHHAAPMCQLALDETRHVTATLPRPPTLQRLAYKLITVALPSHKRQFMREILYGCYRHTNPFDQACAPVWWEKARENVESRLKQPLKDHELKRWLNHPLIRWVLGERREAIYRHLMQAKDN